MKLRKNPIKGDIVRVSREAIGKAIQVYPGLTTQVDMRITRVEKDGARTRLYCRQVSNPAAGPFLFWAPQVVIVHRVGEHAAARMAS